jgi:superfamily II DNA or RNA helicase
MLSLADKSQFSSLKDVDLIICDECHRLGGKRTSVALHTLLNEYCKNVDLCGATATPERMDLVDEITEFFDNNVTSTYTLHDAFMDDIIKKPYYCYCSADYKDDFENISKMTNAEIEKMDNAEDRMKQVHKLNEHLTEISKLVRMPNIIRSTCNECIEDTSYMKFIIFCANIEHTHKCFDEVKRWFSEAYPSHDIKTLIITSEKEETKNNVKKLSSFKHRENGIDLIFSCDMLNMGYHISDLTGIVMYRLTNSSIIYAQQLGRVINSGSDKHGLVFDVVDNIHRRSLYDVMGDSYLDVKDERVALRKYESRIAKTEDATHEYGNLSQTEIEEYLSLKSKYEPIRNSKKYGRYEGLSSSDLIVTSFSASYKELIEKTIAEPISMRCRQTYEYWVRSGGKTTGKYAGIAGVLMQEKAAREVNYGYANKAVSNNVPITPFAKIKKVSVECVLETIFGKKEVYEYRDAINEVMSNTLPRVRENV